jgi:hypothetical protein
MFGDKIKNVLYGFAKWLGFKDRANIYRSSVIFKEKF